MTTIPEALAARPALKAIVKTAGWRTMTSACHLTQDGERHIIEAGPDREYIAHLDAAPFVQRGDGLESLHAYIDLFVAAPQLLEALIMIIEWGAAFDTCPFCGADSAGSHRNCPWLKARLSVNKALMCATDGHKF